MRGRLGQSLLGVATASAALATLCACQNRNGLNTAGASSNANSVFEIFSPPSPAEAAAWAVDPYDSDKRYRGMLLLANAPWGGEEVYVRLYEVAIDDEDANVRAAAIRGLSMHGGPEHAPRIARELSRGSRLLRWEAARALQRLHNPVVVPDLLQALDQPNLDGTQGEEEPSVRSAAAHALGQYAQTRVLDGLIASLSDRHLSVNRAAEQSLQTLTGQDFGFDGRAWVAWKNNASDPFAGQIPYEYPIFERGRRGLEWVLPFMRPPNEIASSPAGMPDPLAPDSDGSAGDGG